MTAPVRFPDSVYDRISSYLPTDQREMFFRCNKWLLDEAFAAQLVRVEEHAAASAARRRAVGGSSSSSSSAAAAAGGAK